MTTDRWHKPYSTAQKPGTNGRPACLECGGDITVKARSTFCRKACADAFSVKTSGSAVRVQVLIRDKGLCSKCGVDVFKRAELETGHPRIRRARNSGDLWQADHIVPVVEGGGACGLENYRTLCTPCHKVETATLAARRAAARNPNGRLNLEPATTDIGASN